MESTSQKNHDPKSNEKEEHRSDQKTVNKFKEIISKIPKKQGVWVFDLYQYEGFWGSEFWLEGMLSIQDYFKPQPNQVIVGSL